MKVDGYEELRIWEDLPDCAPEEKWREGIPIYPEDPFKEFEVDFDINGETDD